MSYQITIGEALADEGMGRGVIRPIGYVASTDPGTHAHPVRLWQGVTA